MDRETWRNINNYIDALIREVRNERLESKADRSAIVLKKSDVLHALYELKRVFHR